MTPSPGARPPRRIRVVATAAAVCAVALLASSCSTHPSDTAFTGPTVFLPMPSPTSSPTGPDYQTDVPTASAQLYQQAHDVYVIYLTYDAGLQQDGGATELPPELKAILTGAALSKETNLHQQAKQAGLRWVGTPTIRTVKVAQLFDKVPSGTVIALQACEETSGAQLWDGSGHELADGRPILLAHHYYMKYNAQHQLVIYNLTGGTERLDTCPF